MNPLPRLSFAVIALCFLAACETPPAKPPATAAQPVKMPAALVLVPVRNSPDTVRQMMGVKGPWKDIGDLTHKPVPIFQPVPSYPFELHRAGIQGNAVIAFVIGPEGTVVSTAIVSATDVRFGEAAEAAIRKWTFHPGEANGHKVYTFVAVPIGFTLSDH